MSNLRALGVAIVAALTGSLATASPELTWRVINRFPLLTPAAFEKIERRWEAGEHKSMVMHITNRLEDKDNGRIPPQEFLLTDPIRETVKTSALFTAAPNVWVEAELKNPLGSCAWQTVLSIEATSDPCKVKISVPYDTPSPLSVTSGERTFTTELFVRDIVVVSMGDSYSSGEGSPDRPAIYEKSRNTPKWNDWFLWEGPSPVTTPVWWDSPCHRSLLSWPVLSTLRIALTQTHSTVRLLNVSCSGAEFMDGIFLAQERAVIRSDESRLSDTRRDGLPASGWPTYPKRFLPRSQVNEARDILCAAEEPGAKVERIGSLPKGDEATWRPCTKVVRRPDALVITGGGNDAKFGPAVKGVMVPNKTVSGSLISEVALAKVRDLADAIPVEMLGAGADAMGERYPDYLQTAAKGVLLTPDKAVLLKYPNPIGEFNTVTKVPVDCWSARQQLRIKNTFMSFGPTARELAGPLATGKVNWVVELDPAEVREFTQKAYPKVQEMQEKLPPDMTSVEWNNANRDLFAARLICSPVLDEKVGLETTFFCNDSAGECESPFQRKSTLGEFRFEAPGRLMVNSTNDSILSLRTWQGRKPTKNDLVVAVSGSMHPTSEAHALAADSMYASLCKVLRAGSHTKVCPDIP